MAPKQVTTIDLNELKEIELRCECGTTVRLPLPLKSGNLIEEQDCPGCTRKMWAYQSPVRTKIANLLSAVKDWNDAGYTTLVCGS